MRNEATEDLAVRYVLGELTGEETTRFESELAADAELQKFLGELTETYAAFALAVPPEIPPSFLPERITQPKAYAPTRRYGRSLVTFIPWALAACLAVVAAILFIDRIRVKNELAQLGDRSGKLEQEVQDLRSKSLAAEREVQDLRGKSLAAETQLAQLRKTNVLSQLTIATLQAQVNQYARAGAVAVWNPEQSSGIVQFNDLPAAQPGKTYQLWIIDPKQAQPVSAGLIPVSDRGKVRANLRPAKPISTAAKFAVSIENAGGSETPKGQIVLLGQ
jgi:anti-sigma-K factor RskA